MISDLNKIVIIIIVVVVVVVVVIIIITTTTFVAHCSLALGHFCMDLTATT